MFGRKLTCTTGADPRYAGPGPLPAVGRHRQDSLGGRLSASATIIAPGSIVTVPGGTGHPVIAMPTPAGGRSYLDLSEHGRGHDAEGMLLVAASR